MCCCDAPSRGWLCYAGITGCVCVCVCVSVCVCRPDYVHISQTLPVIQTVNVYGNEYAKKNIKKTFNDQNSQVLLCGFF